MKRSRITGGLGLMATLLMAGTLTVSPAEASSGNRDNKDKNPSQDKAKSQQAAAYKDLTVEGVVLDAFWAPAKTAGQWTATIKIWSDEADQAVTVYGDDPSVRDAIASGTVCIGTYAVAYGDRETPDVLIGRTVTVPYPDMPCSGTIPPPPS